MRAGFVLFVVLLPLVVSVGPAPAGASTAPESSDGVADDLVAVADVVRGGFGLGVHVDLPRSAMEPTAVEVCMAPGPGCAYGPFRVRERLEVEILPTFVGAVDVDVRRGLHLVHRITCESDGFGLATCHGAPEGELRPGSYTVVATARAGTVGTWVLAIHYA